MILRLLSAALAAGFLAAVVATGLQLVLTSPLIVAAERYETQASAPSAPGLIQPAHVHLAHDHG
ncbi:CbtA family protein, partial [Stenotrophomonas maltophilia]